MRKFLENNLKSLEGETNEFAKGLRDFLQVALDVLEKEGNLDGFGKFLAEVNTNFEEENEFNKGLKTAHQLTKWAFKEGLE